MCRKISSHVDGGPSGGSSVRRPGSGDPHRHKRKFDNSAILQNIDFLNVWEQYHTSTPTVKVFIFLRARRGSESGKWLHYLMDIVHILWASHHHGPATATVVGGPCYLRVRGVKPCNDHITYTIIIYLECLQELSLFAACRARLIISNWIILSDTNYENFKELSLMKILIIPIIGIISIEYLMNNRHLFNTYQSSLISQSTHTEASFVPGWQKDL